MQNTLTAPDPLIGRLFSVRVPALHFSGTLETSVECLRQCAARALAGSDDPPVREVSFVLVTTPAVRSAHVDVMIEDGMDVVNALSMVADAAGLGLAFCTLGLLIAPKVVCGCIDDHQEYQSLTTDQAPVPPLAIDLNTRLDLVAKYPITADVDSPAANAFSREFHACGEDGSMAVPLADIFFDERPELDGGAVATYLRAPTIPGLP